MKWYYLIIFLIIFAFYYMIKTKYNFDFINFANVLGLSESSNSYKTNTGNGAYGRYQFISPTIDTISNELNINVTIEEFLNSPSLQDAFYFQYVNDILNYISSHLNNFIGTKITSKTTGLTTTANIYGLVAGAWLGGNGGLYNFFVNGIDKKDSNGTYISDYIYKFSNQMS